MKKFKCESVRLCRFLYSLGFDKTSEYGKDGKEYWLFNKSRELQESLDFYFLQRKKIQERMNNEQNIYKKRNNGDIE